MGKTMTMEKQIIVDSINDIKYFEAKGDNHRVRIMKDGLKRYKEVRREIKK